MAQSPLKQLERTLRGARVWGVRETGCSFSHKFGRMGIPLVSLRPRNGMSSIKDGDPLSQSYSRGEGDPDLGFPAPASGQELLRLSSRLCAARGLRWLSEPTESNLPSHCWRASAQGQHPHPAPGPPSSSHWAIFKQASL